jgi:hypothetical protein
MPSVKFKYADQACVYPKLINAVNVLCVAKGKDANCVSGYRSLENQKATNKSVLNSTKGSIQRADGSVYSKDGKCLAAAFGKSNHCFGLAMDIDSPWFKSMTNAQLKPFGLITPMDYEPWHVELIETRELTADQKPAFYFQYTHGLLADGIAGPKTKAKMAEVQETINKITKGGK